MAHYFGTLFLILISTNIAAVPPSFEEYKNQINKDQKQYSQEQVLRFCRYKQAVREGLTAYKTKIKKHWGFSEVSTDHKYVAYSKDFSEKLVINYKNNTIALERLPSSTEGSARQLIQTTLQQQAIPSLRQSVAKTLGIPNQNIGSVANQLLSQQYEIDSSERVRSNVEDLRSLKRKLDLKSSSSDSQSDDTDSDFRTTIEAELAATEAVLATPNNKPKTTTTEIRLPEDKRKKAMLYSKYVKTQSRKYGLPSSLIFGVMEVESAFNPRAQSPVPAFGLMQIVPMSAGVDANAFLNRGANAPSRAELFQPNNNVLLGSTYLYILYNRYFKNVNNETSRLYCALAAYNTGMGNVASLFTPDGSKTMKPAIERINSMSKEQVYEKIVSQAHPETRQYLVKVLDAQKRYNGL